jgi:hypothetical protein
MRRLLAHPVHVSHDKENTDEQHTSTQVTFCLVLDILPVPVFGTVSDFWDVKVASTSDGAFASTFMQAE